MSETVRPLGLADRIAAAVSSRPGDAAALPRTHGLRPHLPAAQPAAQPAAAPPRPQPRQPVIHGWVRPSMRGEVLSLMPGELHFGGQPAALRTLLGSCVAVTLWHPERRIGGMCHFLLPERVRPHEERDGRYGDDAVAAMVQALRSHGTEPGEYLAHLYGGADTMSEVSGVKFNVGERNIEKGWALIDRYGFTLDGIDVGDYVPRTVTLTIASGQVECRRGRSP